MMKSLLLMQMHLSILFYFLIYLSLLLLSASEYIDDYAIVVDAGSTGSRCFVFHIVIDGLTHRNISSHPCGKVVPGLSTFATHPNDASDYIAPLLNIAATRIPAAFHARTPVHIKATAGMRLLPEVRQSILWHSLVSGLNKRSDIPFLITKDTIGTIDGHDEAFFAVLASNYIAGSIDGNLHPIEGMPLLGALDMGGSSTQLIFYNGTSDVQKIHADDFWSHSWLNYGAHRVYERVLDYLEAEHIHHTLTRSIQQLDQSTDSADIGDLLHPTGCKDLIIENPCSFVKHKLLRTHNNYNEPTQRNIVFTGTGDAKECTEIIEKVIWPEEESSRGKEHRVQRKGQPIDEIEHPAVHGHHFYAMSVYFYALDCMRQLGPLDLDYWPSPSLAEIERAAYQFCGMQWQELEASAQGANQHPYTPPQQLGDRCFEVVYIATLLEKGFGFDPEERSITFALEVGGKEVEWTLGFALAEIDFSAHLLDQAERDYQKALELQHYFLHRSAQNMIACFRNIWKSVVYVIQTVFWKIVRRIESYVSPLWK